ncbi:MULTISPECIES: ABC transporter substrate-binding protein [Deinococcus]|jgi:NitT/TauT family transport system substrate-binding protein|uniref:ABC transporter substrate-binding protein n=2 Tax=Deinococcus soli (ex Cha et al. 2016) TaxID=1309411 RepID=A0A0F7JUH8_9DEIO|nr:MULTISPECIES: ABC transporter substrate-binding protein [Deinococcus]AKH18293.1 ABC transporter substrate-binding protein [Deinococcus soli (ex Cha et al. 2016)]MDK2011742.1 ABC transporter substrate-binding protein [Deinococcus sp. 43]MDR6216526.1 NitT/TauT family transport system substrate-binding protein [Deinococcus soli (ex Cha et al. 2016)]MDR6327347.1 NitT/TauT family transport system substrate-binding protein [Deinococcus soli (ex Cha et al. 2016)]MDR6749622.1 NitT/TauT family trans
MTRLTLPTLLTLSLLTTAAAQDAQTVRLGFFPNLTHAPALVGLERGTFQKALGKVKLDAKEFVSGTTLTEAFAAGQIDIAYVGPGPAINAAGRGMPVQFLAGASEAGAVLVVRKDSGIKSYRDLAGKLVAVPSLGNTQDISLRHILNENGLKSKTDGGNVTITPVAPVDVLAAFAAKRVEATLVPEPWGAALEAQGHKVIGTEKTVWRDGKYPTTVVIVNAKFAQANPQLVAAFLKAHTEAVAFINKSPVGAQTAVNAQLLKLTGAKLDPRVLQRAFSRTRFTTSLDLAALTEYAKLNVEAGYARSAPDLAPFIRK